MAIAAIVHKGRLKRRLDPSYFCEVDIASKLAFILGFKVKFINLVSVCHHNASFLGVGGVDKHFLSHVVHLHPARLTAPGGLKRREGCLVWAKLDARYIANRRRSGASCLNSPVSVSRLIAFLSPTRTIQRAVSFTNVHLRALRAICVGQIGHNPAMREPVLSCGRGGSETLTGATRFKSHRTVLL